MTAQRVGHLLPVHFAVRAALTWTPYDEHLSDLRQ